MPIAREIEHCGSTFEASPFDYYVVCPVCGERMKQRGLGGVETLEDVFDAVFEWIERNRADEIVERRRAEIRAHLASEEVPT